MEQIKSALAHWGITDFAITERYHEATERVLCRIETENRTYFLKGIPREKGEGTVRGNVWAHEYLGNRALSTRIWGRTTSCAGRAGRWC